MPWEVPITVDGLEYPVRFDTENEPTQEDIAEAVKQITAQKTPERPFLDITDTASALGRAATSLATTVPASLSQAWEGLENPWKRSDSYMQRRQEMQALQEEMQRADEEAATSGDLSSVSSTIRQAIPSLGFSGATLAPSIAAYGGTLALTKSPTAATGAAAATSGLMAYRMAGAQFLDDAKDRIDQFFLENFERPPTEKEQEEAYNELLPLARKFGAAEAGPEALGNLALGGAGKYIRRALGGKNGIMQLASDALGKVTGAKAALAGAGATLSEIGTEAVTGVEQDRIQRQFEEGVMRGESPENVALPDRSFGDYMKSFEEVAPTTLALTGMMGAAGLGPTAISRGVRSLRKPEPEIQIAAEALNATTDTPFTDISGQAAADTIAQNTELAMRMPVQPVEAAEEIAPEVTPSPEMETPPPPQGVDMALAPLSPIINEAPLSEGTDKKAPHALSKVEAINKTKADLDERAKALGYDNARQLNLALQTQSTLSDEQRQVLESYSLLNQEIKALSWEDASELSDGDFSTWVKPRFPAENPKMEEELRDAADLHRALTKRGDTQKAEQIRDKIKNAKRRQDWTTDSWNARFPDEPRTQEEVDTLNAENAAWNAEVDAIIESFGETPILDEPPSKPKRGKKIQPITDLAAQTGEVQGEVITPQGEPTTATEGMVTPGGVATERDVSKPEQMTPDEVNSIWNDAKDWANTPDSEIVAKYQKQFNASDAYIQAHPFAPEYWRETQRKIISGASPLKQHTKVLNSAIAGKKPVSAAAVDTYGITLPEGYTRQGDLYVFQPQTTAAEKQTPVPLRKGTGEGEAQEEEEASTINTSTGATSSQQENIDLIKSDLALAEEYYREAKSKSDSALDEFYSVRNQFDTRKNPPRNFTYRGPKSESDRILKLAQAAHDASVKVNLAARDVGKLKASLDKVKSSSLLQKAITGEPTPQTKAAETQTPESVAVDSGAAGVVQSEPSRESILEVEKESTKTAIESTGKSAPSGYGEVVNSARKSLKERPADFKTQEQVLSDLMKLPVADLQSAFEVVTGSPTKLANKRQLANNVLNELLAEAQESQPTAAEDTFRKAEQEAEEEIQRQNAQSIANLFDKLRTNPQAGQVTRADVNQAIGALQNSGEVPNAIFTWNGTTDDLLRQRATMERQFPGAVAAASMPNVEGVFENGMAFVFSNRVVVTDLDRRKAAEEGISPSVAAVKRVVTHENMHKGLWLLSPKQQSDIMSFLRQMFPAAELDELAKSYRQYADWRTNPVHEMALLDERLQKYIEETKTIPTDGVWKQFWDYIKEIWRKLTGKPNGEPTLQSMKDVVRLIRSALKNAHKARPDRTIDGGRVLMSVSGGRSFVPAVNIDGRVEIGASHYDAWIKHALRQIPNFKKDGLSDEERRQLADRWIVDHPEFMAYSLRKEGFVSDGEFLNRQDSLKKFKSLGGVQQMAPGEPDRDWLDASDVEGYRFSYASEQDEASSIGQQTARYAASSPRTIEAIVGVRQAYASMPKSNGAAVMLDDLFAETAKLVPNLTRPEFDRVVQGMYDDNAVLLNDAQNPSSVTILPGAMMSMTGGANDAEYLAAVEAGDMEKAQRMVDEAAKAAGFNVGPVWHGSPEEDFTEFQKPEKGSDEDGFWFSKDREWASKFGPTRLFYIKNAKTWGGDDFVTKESSDIKSADPVTYDDAGNVIPPSQRFQTTSPDIRFSIASTPEQQSAGAMMSMAGGANDAEYMAAVEAGDMEKAQRMVDEAANKALALSKARENGKLMLLQHETPVAFTVFKPGGDDPSRSGPAIWLGVAGSSLKAGHRLGNRKNPNLKNMRLFADIRNPLLLDDEGMVDWAREVFLDGKSDRAKKEFPLLLPEDVAARIKAEGYDGIIFDTKEDRAEMQRRIDEHVKQMTRLGNSTSTEMKPFDKAEIIVFSPEQIKSADPVTRDAAGNVIPLSQRFQSASPDIRFSIASTPEQQSAAAKFKSAITAAAKGLPDLREYEGRLAKAASGEAIDVEPHNVLWFDGFMKASEQLLSDLQKQGLSLQQIYDKVAMDTEFKRELGLFDEETGSGQAATVLSGLLLQRTLNAARKARTAEAKAQGDALHRKAAAYYSALATARGQNLLMYRLLQNDPRTRFAFMEDKVTNEMLKKAEHGVNVQFGDGYAATQKAVNDAVDASAEAAKTEVADAVENAAEEDQDAIDLAEGEATLDAKGKTLWEKFKDLIRKRGIAARALNAIRSAKNARQSIAKSERDSISQMSEEELVKFIAGLDSEMETVFGQFVGGSDETTRKKREKMVKTAKKRAEKGKDIDIKPTDVSKIINQVRRDIKTPSGKPIQWREIFRQPGKTVEEYRQNIFNAVNSNEAFKDLDEAQKRRLSELFAEAWQAQRDKILKSMIEQHTYSLERQQKKEAAKALRDARNQIIEAVNLGAFSNDELTRVLGEKFGFKTSFTEDEKQKLSELAEKLQDEKLNKAKRNKLAREFLSTLQSGTQIPIAELLSNWWVSAVLSGGNTVSAIALSFLNGTGIGIMGTHLSRALRELMKGNTANAIDAITSLFKAYAKHISSFPVAANRAWQYLRSGDVSFLESAANDPFGRVNTLADIAKYQVVADQVAKDPNKVKAVMGRFMQFMGRLLTALDAFNVMVTKAGTVSLAIRQSGLTPEQIRDAELKNDLKFYKDKIVREDPHFGGKQPTSAKEKAYLSSLAEAEMYADLAKMGVKMENADYLASESAMTMNPTGVGGIVYNAIKALDAKVTEETRKHLQMAEIAWAKNKTVENATILFAWRAINFAAEQGLNAFGLRFARFAGNKFNQSSSFVPVLGLLRMIEADNKELAGRQEAFKDTIIRNQSIGAILMFAGWAIIKAIEEEPDDEKRGWFLNGGWNNLTPDQKKQKLSKGEKQYTIGIGDYVFNYQNWPISQPLAALGELSDLIRYSQDKWKAKTAGGKAGSAVISGMQAALEIPALTQVGEIFGNTMAAKDPAEQTVSRISRVTSGWLGGFMPRILKDLDYMQDPTMRRYETLFQKVASHVPVYRRYVGSDYYDILGNKIEKNAIPGSRDFMKLEDKPEYRMLGALNARGIWLTPANAEYRMVGKGRFRRRLTQEEADRYSLETGKLYRQMVMNYGPRALQMPVERAKDYISAKADDMRDLALQRAVSN